MLFSRSGIRQFLNGQARSAQSWRQVTGKRHNRWSEGSASGTLPQSREPAQFELSIRLVALGFGRRRLLHLRSPAKINHTVPRRHSDDRGVILYQLGFADVFDLHRADSRRAFPGETGILKSEGRTPGDSNHNDLGRRGAMRRAPLPPFWQRAEARVNGVLAGQLLDAEELVVLRQMVAADQSSRRNSSGVIPASRAMLPIV